MAYYGSREDRDRAARNIIADKREMAALFAAIRPIIQDFDGRVYNCRFDRALKEIITEKHIYSSKKYNHLYIEAHGSNSNRWYTLASIRLDELTDGKRIPADLFIQSAREYREKWLKEAASLERNIDSIDTIQQQIKIISAQLNALLQPLDYTTRDIYGLNARITYS